MIWSHWFVFLPLRWKAEVRVPISCRVLLNLLLCSVLLSGCSKEPPAQSDTPRLVKALKVADYAGFYNRRFPGKAQAVQEVDLAFDVAGTLVERPIKIGDRVTKNQLIARVDQRDFLAQVKSARAQLTKDTANFNRAKELLVKAFVSQSEYDTLEAQVETADSALLVVQKALADSELKAPFAGVIANTYVDNFQAIMPKQPVARLLDSSQIEFVINIPEQYISLAPTVTNLHVRFDAFKSLDVAAEIREISNEASDATRTYPVTLIMDQPEGAEILPGMAGVASGRDNDPGPENRAIEVPVVALFSPDDKAGSYVWVIDEASMKVTRRQVTAESLTEGGIQITEGLQVGEWIAIAGVHYLKEGQVVRILEAEGE
jgi:RND family efflux transporter MFP subunit